MENTLIMKGYVLLERERLSRQIPMPTLVNKYNMEDPADPHASHIIVIPSFDGRCDILKTATERLKVQAVGVHLAPDMEGESIPEIAANIRKTLKTTLNIKSKFYILGYSFGVNIAMELAALLEKEGHSGVIYCLDSSPDALKINLDAYLGKLTEDKLQNIVLHHVFKLVAGKMNEHLKVNLEKLGTLEEKVKITVKELKKVYPCSEEYRRSVLKSAYDRIKLAYEYKPCIKLHSDIILLKGIAHPNSDLADDYNLSQYTYKPINIFELEYDHGLAHQDPRVSNIVNKFLDGEILEDFKKLNLCNSIYIES